MELLPALWHQTSEKVCFDIQPIIPQADIAATGRCKYWIIDVDFMRHHWTDTESPSDDPKLPKMYTATVACIYNVDGKCKGLLTPERLNILQRALEKAIYSGLHWQHSPAPLSLASELVSLITRKDTATSRHAIRWKLILTYASPPHHHRPTKLGPIPAT